MARIQAPADAQAETVERRTIYSKTYDMGGRKFRQIISPSVVHYPDDGELHDIDTDFVFSEGTYSVPGACYLIAVTPGVVGFEYSSRFNGTVNVTLIELDDAPFTPNFDVEVDGNDLWLRDLIPDLDLLIRALPAKMELWKVIKTASGPHIFTWEIVEDDAGNSFSIQNKTFGRDNLDNIEPPPPRNEERRWRREVEVLNETGEPDLETNPGKRTYTFREEVTGRTAKIGLVKRIKTWEENIIYPVELDADVTENIVADADDGHGWYTTGPGNGWSSRAAQTYLIHRYDGTNTWNDPGFRFQGVNVPQAATIDAATLKLNLQWGRNGTPTGYLYGNDHDDAPVWAAGNTPRQMTKTAAKVVFDVPAGSGAWNHSITAIVQEVVDRTGWASGNDMAFGGINNNTILAYGYIADYPDANDAVLEIDYTVAVVIPRHPAAYFDGPTIF